MNDSVGLPNTSSKRHRFADSAATAFADAGVREDDVLHETWMREDALAEFWEDLRKARPLRRPLDFLRLGAFAFPVKAKPKAELALDILSNTGAVDFGPYLLEEVMSKVRERWSSLISESAQAKKGRLAIEFAIMKDGQVAEMRITARSGDEALDRPAWGSIKNSNPLKGYLTCLDNSSGCVGVYSQSCSPVCLPLLRQRFKSTDSTTETRTTAHGIAPNHKIN